MQSGKKNSRDLDITAGFMRSLQQHPDDPALFINERFYTYSQMYGLAEIVLGSLLPARRRHFIGIYCSNDVMTYAGILAAGIIGACYVPLNPALGEKKIAQIINDACIECILTTSPVDYIAEDKQIIINSTKKYWQINEWYVDQPFAYLLYTSGSTGEPKGVPVRKEGVKSLFSHFLDHFDFTSADRFLQPYDLSWDVSVFCLFAAWNAGACSYVVPREVNKPIAMLDLIQKYELTVVSMVPSTLTYIDRYLPEVKLPSVRHTIFAGESLLLTMARNWKSSAINSIIYNYYGPTEATIYSAGYRWDEGWSRSAVLPVGKVLEGFSYLIRTEEGVQADRGILFLSGPQVIDAYLNDRDHWRFILVDGKKYYNTGDEVSIDEDGNLVFHARNDLQIKVDGYRIELQEIEEFILMRTGIHAVVRPLELPEGKRLVAFLKGGNPDKILNLIRAELPAHMCPHLVLSLTELPVGNNGKVDVHELQRIVDEQRNAK
jgi:non-ribosomal peptide synthetase component F